MVTLLTRKILNIEFGISLFVKISILGVLISSMIEKNYLLIFYGIIHKSKFFEIMCSNFLKKLEKAYFELKYLQNKNAEDMR